MKGLILVALFVGLSGSHNRAFGLETEETVVVIVSPARSLRGGASRKGALVSGDRSMVPPRFQVLQESGTRKVLRGPRSQIPALEKRGLAVRDVIPVPAASQPAAKAGGASALSFTQEWAPLEFPGEIITDIEAFGPFWEEKSIVVGTKSEDWSSGKVYFYSRQGSLQWSHSLPLGVDRIIISWDDYIVAVTSNENNDRGGVYVYDLDGELLGSWVSDACGISGVYYWYDLNNDGQRELVIDPNEHNVFYVLSSTGELLGSGTVTDPIVNLDFSDLVGDGNREIIVFSGNQDPVRGSVTVFNSALEKQGSRDYGPADLGWNWSWVWADYIDLDGNGNREIIIDPWHLNQRLEILSSNCALLYSDSLGRDIWYFSIWHDFNDNDRRDIVLTTEDWDAGNARWHGYLDFNGTGFASTWAYPADAPLPKEVWSYSMDAENIAFGTRDADTLSGCHLYLINTIDGTEAVSPVPVTGSVNDVIYADLNNDSNKEVAILTLSASSERYWNLYVYDSNLQLLVPEGHLSFTASRDWNWLQRWWDWMGEGVSALIPIDDQGSMVRVANYDGTLRWSYDLPGDISRISTWQDVDGDGFPDLVVVSAGSGGGGHAAILKDQGTGPGVIGERSFPDPIDRIDLYDFNRDGRRESVISFVDSPLNSIYSYNLASRYWSFFPPGNDVLPLSYYDDIDADGINDVIVASNNPDEPRGWLNVFFGRERPAHRIQIDWGDYTGDGTSDIAIFRPASGLWAVRNVTRVYFGGGGDLPVPGDYSGDGTTDIAIFRESSGLWAVSGGDRAYFGTWGDIPVPGDYDASGTTDIGVYRAGSGLWAIRGVTRFYFGAGTDIPVPGYYNGIQASPGIFRPSSGLWAIQGITRTYFGSVQDEPVPGDYDGEGFWSPAIFRPASGLWAIHGGERVYFGGLTDSPIPGDYKGDGTDYPGIFRSTSGLWAIRGVTRVYFGSGQDIPVTR